MVVAGPPFAAPWDRKRLEKDPDSETRLTLLVADREGYRNLCRLLTAGALGHAKGEARVDLDLLSRHTAGLHCLVGGIDDPVTRALERTDAHVAQPSLFGGKRLGKSGQRDPMKLACGRLEWLTELYPDRLHIELQRHGLRDEEHKNRALIELAHSMHLPLVATNGVRYARPADRHLQDVMTCIRRHTHLDDAGRLLRQEQQRFFKNGVVMERLFADQPAAIGHAHELAQELDFTLADLGYRFPDCPLPPGETPSSYLRQLTWNGARARFRPLTSRAQAQIEKELDLIEKLELDGYFLIVHDIVRFCIENKILAQGRGSAANSAVCYALSITAVDPVKMGLLFERFLSEERGEWPDIDLDLPSGDQRESVIQYVYQRYGPQPGPSGEPGEGFGAAMTANVITYRDQAWRHVRSRKALGYSTSPGRPPLQAARQLVATTVKRGDKKAMDEELSTGAGFDPERFGASSSSFDCGTRFTTIRAISGSTPAVW